DPLLAAPGPGAPARPATPHGDAAVLRRPAAAAAERPGGAQPDRLHRGCVAGPRLGGAARATGPAGRPRRLPLRDDVERQGPALAGRAAARRPGGGRHRAGAGAVRRRAGRRPPVDRPGLGRPDRPRRAAGHPPRGRAAGRPARRAAAPRRPVAVRLQERQAPGEPGLPARGAPGRGQAAPPGARRARGASLAAAGPPPARALPPDDLSDGAARGALVAPGVRRRV
ncbi:MAG: hypothetical protein AVDCRST_MAG32-1322, partial [uncultured Nocardioides sp.]